MRLTRRTGSAAALTALFATLAFASSAGAATFTVNTTLDTNDTHCTADTDGCSLRDAVYEANHTSGSDTIVLPAGRYKFDPQTGTGPDIDDATTLTGAGAATTIIDANGRDDVFDVSPDVTFTASGVTLTGGTVGAVFMNSGSTVAFTDARLTRNQDSQSFGGGAIGNDGGDLTLTRTEIDHNTASHSGGAIENVNGVVHIVDSWIHANHSEADGGAIDNFLGNECEGSCGDAFAASNDIGHLTIEGSTLSDNVADNDGGAIYTSGDVQKQVAARASLTAVPIGPASVEITNSTLSGNTSDDGGGGEGGAIAANDSDVALTSSTVYGNHAPNADGSGHGAGIWTGGASTVSLRNTLLDENIAGGHVENCDGSGFNSLGHNLESGDTCGLTGTGDLKNTDPKLGPLRDNGGLTPTHQLLDGSPAIEAGDGGPGLDQRGGKRPPDTGSSGSVRDIGAYEAYSLSDLSTEIKFDAPDPVTAGKPLTYSIVVRNNGPDRINGVAFSDPVPSGTTFASVSSTVGSCNAAVSCSLGSLDPGAVVGIQIVVTPDAAGSRTNVASVSASGYTETNPANDSASAGTTFVAAPATLPPGNTPGGQGEQAADKTVILNFKAPEQITLDQFMDGFVVEADCGDEQCLRRFREHASINTGATHIAGFNLTVTRGALGFKGKTRIRLKPCTSGSSSGAHRRCVRNLRKAAKKALPFRVKVVCSAIDKAENRIAKKLYVKVVDN